MLDIGGPAHPVGDPRTLDLVIVRTQPNGCGTYEQNLTDAELISQVHFVWNAPTRVSHWPDANAPRWDHADQP